MSCTYNSFKNILGNGGLGLSGENGFEHVSINALNFDVLLIYRRTFKTAIEFCIKSLVIIGILPCLLDLAFNL